MRDPTLQGINRRMPSGKQGLPAWTPEAISFERVKRVGWCERPRLTITGFGDENAVRVSSTNTENHQHLQVCVVCYVYPVTGSVEGW